MSNYETIYDIYAFSVQEFYDLFQHAYWADERTKGSIEKMMRNTEVFLGLRDKSKNKLIGMTRVVTDFTYHAMIVDVIIHKAYRGNGLGERLISETVGHPSLIHMDSYELYCKKELIDFYQKNGFDIESHLVYMRSEKTNK